MDNEPTYGKRLFSAAFEDFTKFWSGHRIWATIAAFTAPLLIQGTTLGWRSLSTLSRIVESALLGLALTLIGNVAISLYRGARSLDKKLHDQIGERDETIVALNEKPRRSAAEQDYFDTGKKLLSGFGGRTMIAVKALRHLLRHGALTYHGPGSNFANLLPEGMNLQDAFWAYNACGSSLIRVDEKYGSGERTYSIPESMKKTLEELLYDESFLRRD
jgi:hypothetical protein